MGVLVMDCPHEDCSATHATFSVEACYSIQAIGEHHWNWVTLACPVCHKGAMVKTITPIKFDHVRATGSILNYVRASVLETHPAPRAKAAPDFVEPNVARTFERANGAIKRGESETAGMLLRKMLDTVISDKFPHTGNGMLGRKMSLLKPNEDLPASMVSWANEIKDYGNESAHEAHEPDMAQIIELRNFSELLLTYVYTLPHRLEQMRPNP